MKADSNDLMWCLFDILDSDVEEKKKKAYWSGNSRYIIRLGRGRTGRRLLAGSRRKESLTSEQSRS
jgi:hypothetical protein